MKHAQLLLVFIFLLSKMSIAQESDFIPVSNLDFDTQFDCYRNSDQRLWNVLKLNNDYYRFEPQSKKWKGQCVYSIDIVKIDTQSSVPYKNIGHRTNLIDRDTTINRGAPTFFSQENYFAIVKIGNGPVRQFASLHYLYDGEGIDIYVFNTENFELVYKQSISLSNRVQKGKILKMEFDDSGNLFILSSLKYIKEKSNPKDNPEGAITLTKITQSGNILRKEIESKRVLCGHFSKRNNIISRFSLLGISEGNNVFKISTFSADPEAEGESIDEKEVSLDEIINFEKRALCFGEFSKNAAKSDKLTVTLDPSMRKINHFTTDSGTDIISYPLDLASRGGARLIFNLIVKMDQNGQINWLQTVPIQRSLLTLVDGGNNIHLFTNGSLKNYENSMYSDNKINVLGSKVVPVEIILDSFTGEIISNTIFLDEDIPPECRFLAPRCIIDDKTGIMSFWGNTDDANKINKQYGHIKLM